MTVRKICLMALGALAAAVASISLIGCESGSASHAAPGFAPSRGAVGAPNRDDIERQRINRERELQRRSDGLHPAREIGQTTPGPIPLARGEELWIISKPDRHRVQMHTGTEREAHPTHPGLARAMEDGRFLPMPLERTEVEADLSGFIASVGVTQQYVNPFDVKIEAVYVFPLPHNAAVTDFLMTIGNRTIRGVIREREEAAEMYLRAREQGKIASIMTEERPNIFTQRVANIEPGRSIEIDITYFHTLAYEQGELTFVFPTVVGPRYNPPGSRNTIVVGPRETAGGHDSSTEVPYLAPGEITSHRFGMNVRIVAGVPIESVVCPSHEVDVRFDNQNPGLAHVTLTHDSEILDRDFVLKYRVAGDDIHGTILTHRDERGTEGGFFTLLLHPPSQLDQASSEPIEVFFLIDTSGSMRGAPLETARRAVESVLRCLRPQDTFQIFHFGTRAYAIDRSPVAATHQTVSRAINSLGRLRAEGGTEVIQGLRAVASVPGEPGRSRVVVLLSDGLVSNDDEVLAEVDRLAMGACVFTVGIGSAPNRALVERISRVGGGVAAYVGLNEDPATVMSSFMRSIMNAAMTDIRIDGEGIRAFDVYPRRAPNLYAGRPVVLSGRYDARRAGTVRVMGRVNGNDRMFTLPVDTSDATRGSAAIASIWAGHRIAELSDLATRNPNPQIREDIRRTALDFGLVSAFTAFIAVDSLSRTAGDYGHTIRQPVPVPEGVRYDTTVR